MDIILKVLEGSKTGTKIAVKKDEFLIGRSHKCHLCAGSTTISRRHCAIRRQGTAVSIEDLGSRNGTLVNDKKITEPTPLSSGDEIAVGSLKFLVTISQGINNSKKPEVKSVAEAVDRAATSESQTFDDDDISKWLLDGGTGRKAATETQTIQLDDTNTAQMKEKLAAQTDAETQHLASDESSDAESSDAAEEKPDSDEEQDTDSSSKKKKQPGKLPPVPNKPASKDSREAAMDALRNWNRRR